MSHVFAFRTKLGKLQVIPDNYVEKLTTAYLAKATIRVGGEFFGAHDCEAWTVDFAKGTVISSYKPLDVCQLFVYKLVEK